MRIIHNGAWEQFRNALSQRRFDCCYCRCAFEAGDDEYKTCFSPRDEVYHVVPCPMCGRDCFNNEE